MRTWESTVCPGKSNEVECWKGEGKSGGPHCLGSSVGSSYLISTQNGYRLLLSPLQKNCGKEACEIDLKYTQRKRQEKLYSHRSEIAILEW